MIQFLTPILLFLIFLSVVYRNRKSGSRAKVNLPPGSFGWPFIGESFSLLRAGWEGVPERFVRERIQKHGSPLVFKTSLLGDRMVVLCGPAGNKFLFGNENKLVAVWWPLTMRKLFGRWLLTIRGDEAKWIRKMVLSYLGPDAFATHHAATMDSVQGRRQCIARGIRLELCANNRVGLLSDITRVLQENGLVVLRADLATKMDKCVDITFYVRDIFGKNMDMELVRSMKREMGLIELAVKNEKVVKPDSPSAVKPRFSIGDIFKSQIERLSPTLVTYM